MECAGTARSKEAGFAALALSALHLGAACRLGSEGDAERDAKMAGALVMRLLQAYHQEAGGYPLIRGGLRTMTPPFDVCCAGLRMQGRPVPAMLPGSRLAAL